MEESHSPTSDPAQRTAEPLGQPAPNAPPKRRNRTAKPRIATNRAAALPKSPDQPQGQRHGSGAGRPGAVPALGPEPARDSEPETTHPNNTTDAKRNTSDAIRHTKIDHRHDKERTPTEVETLFNQACQLLSSGLTTRQACKQLGIDPSTLWRYATASDARRDSYAHARDMQARALADETLEVADAATNEGAQVAKLRVDTRKWMASKLLPREFGERLDIESRGWLASIDVTRLSDEQLTRLRAGESALSVLGTPAQVVKALPAGPAVPDK